LLATLEVPEMADDLALAEATQRRSEAETMRARSEIQRAESDHQAAHFMYTRLAEVLKTRPNLVAQQELDAAQSRDRVSEAQIGTARAALAAAEQQVQAAEASKQRVKTLIGYARITAPFAGVITRRNANTGAMIQAGTASQTQAMPVVRLSADDRLRLALPVPESAVPSVRIGAPVEVAVSALQRSFVGTVARFSGRMQSSTRTMETEIDVLNPRRVLIPGMFATVKMIVGQRKGALTVPVQAVADHEKRPSVLVVTPDGKVEERAVTLGVETAERIEIVTGVSAGEWVVIGGRNQLRPGQSVHPQHAEEGR
jgi:RND family efflux transporter MFP subunit